MASKRRKSSRGAQPPDKIADNARLAELGDALRADYDAMKNEPIPENLQQLIEALKAAEAADSEDD